MHLNDSDELQCSKFTFFAGSKYMLSRIKGSIKTNIPNSKNGLWCWGPCSAIGRAPDSSRVLGSIPGLATYFCFSFRFFKKGSCQ